jgi:hypothetical protein
MQAIEQALTYFYGPDVPEEFVRHLEEFNR